MAFVAPRTNTTGEVITAAIANQEWRDNMRETGPGVAVFARDDILTIAAGKGRFYIPSSWGVTKIRGVTPSVGTVSTSGAIILDVNKNGTTIWTTQANRPQIAANSNGGTEDTDMDVTSVAGGDYFTVDIDQAGSNAADLTVEIRFGRE